MMIAQVVKVRILSQQEVRREEMRNPKEVYDNIYSSFVSQMEQGKKPFDLVAYHHITSDLVLRVEVIEEFLEPCFKLILFEDAFYGIINKHNTVYRITTSSDNLGQLKSCIYDIMESLDLNGDEDHYDVESLRDIVNGRMEKITG